MVFAWAYRRHAAAGSLLSALILVLFLAGCADRTPPPPLVETRIVVETRVVEATREVAKTVVVTATPIPTPVYVSRVNAISGTLIYPLAGAPITLNPQQASDDAALLVAQQMYESLYRLRGDGALTPAAAAGYRVSGDGQVYTITLRAGMTWSDGQALMAQHFADGVCRALRPAMGNGYAYLLYETVEVRGARAVAEGDATDCKTVGVRAVDNLTLQIVLERPAAFLPRLFSLPIFWPARLDALANPGARDARSPQPPIPASGPYLLAEHKPGERIVLAKNPAYWNAAAVSFQRIELPIVPDPAAQLALYERGDAHVAEVPAAALSRIRADRGFAAELRALGRAGTSFIGLNTQAEPTRDVAFRRALASAIDRERLIRAVLQQPWRTPARGLIPPGIPGYEEAASAAGYPYSPEAARRYLAEAGYGPDKPIPPVELWYNRAGNNQALFGAIGDMLEAVGIPVRLVGADWDTYQGMLDACARPNRVDAPRSPAECGYGMYGLGWALEYADAASLLETVFGPASPLQYMGWQSKAYADLLAAARREGDEGRRAEIYREAERLLLTEIAVVPLLHYDRTLLVKAGLRFEYPPLGAPDLQFWK